MSAGRRPMTFLRAMLLLGVGAFLPWLALADPGSVQERISMWCADVVRAFSGCAQML